MTTQSKASPLARNNLPQRFFGKQHSLQRRVLLIVGATLSIILFALYFPLELLLMQNTLALETETITTDVERAADNFNSRIDDLALLTRSYATWDETFSFMTTRDPQYLQNHHSTATMQIEQRDFFLITNEQGQVIATRALDPHTGKEIAPPQLPQAPGNLVNPLFDHTTISSLLTSIVLTDQGPLFVSSAPVLHTDGSGPVAGTIIYGRFLTDQVVQEIALHTQLEVALHRFDDPTLPDAIRAVQQQLLQQTHPVVQAIDEYTIHGYTLIQDVFGQPTLILQVTQHRTLYQQGDYHAFYLALALFFTGVTSALVIHFSFERLVLRRLAHLSAETRQIGMLGDSDARVNATGNDELAQLGRSINEMLDALEQAQRDQVQAAEERLHLQDEIIQTRRHLISRVSHELRTPLTPIKGFVDLLLLGSEGPLTVTQQEILKIVRSNTERMTLLVDDLLELGRSEAGSSTLHLSALELQAVIHEALQLFQQEIEQKQIECIIDIANNLLPVEADKKRLSQVLINLISNAVKYTFEQGRITVRALQINAEHVEVQVIDSGVGLTSEQQQQIFTPFYRADSPLHTTTNGTGLGLLIARTIIEQHHGSIYVRSEPGKGSTFGFIIPTSQGSAKPLSAEGALVSEESGHSERSVNGPSAE
jgi:signal transduction histidine kinase